jgi:thiol:disulfide interchange protein DsbA
MNWLRAAFLVVSVTPLLACADADQNTTAPLPAKEQPVEVAQAVANPSAPPPAAKPSPTAPRKFEESVHYVELFDPVPTSVPAGKIEVVEMFWYSCPHCYQMEPELNKWKHSLAKDVELVQIPGVFKDQSGRPNPHWALHARAFYALEALGKVGQVHDKVFAAIHEQGRRLNSIDALARFVASQGVDEQKFREAMSSLAVDTKTRHAIKLTEKYGLTGVPALIVAGR